MAVGGPEGQQELLALADLQKAPTTFLPPPHSQLHSGTEDPGGTLPAGLALRLCVVVLRGGGPGVPCLAYTTPDSCLQTHISAWKAGWAGVTIPI